MTSVKMAGSTKYVEEVKQRTSFVREYLCSWLCVFFYKTGVFGTHATTN